MTICSLGDMALFDSTNSNPVLDYILWSQTPLSNSIILYVATALTVVWTYLWYAGSKPMRSRRVQTWWQLGGYSILLSLGMYRCVGEGLSDIFLRIHEVWHYPQLTDRGTVLYFELEVGWYLSCLICTLINHRAKDFKAMLFHHIITPVEVYFAYQCGYTAITLVILLLHDTSDVFLHLAKTFHNENWTKSTDTTFGIFAFVFFVTRLVLLPMCPYAYFFHNDAPHTTCGTILSSVCFVLVALHAYWFYLIVLMIIKFAKNGNVDGDIRDDELEEDEHNPKPAAKLNAKSPSSIQTAAVTTPSNSKVHKSSHHPHAELAKR